MAEIVSVSEVEEDMTSIGPGRRLAEARKLMGLSQEQMCERLKLTLSVLNKIETDEYDKEVPRTFYRGYIRAYAASVQLDPIELIEDFNSRTGHLEEDNSVRPAGNLEPVTINRDMRYRGTRGKSRFWLVLFLCALFVGVFFATYIYLKKSGFFETVDNAENTVSIELPFVGTVDTEIPKLTSDDDSLSGLNNESTDKTSSQSDDQSAVTTLSEPSLKPANEDQILPSEQVQEVIVSGTKTTDKQVLTMDFSEDCWIKVSDYQNEVILLGLKTQGQSIIIDVQPPIHVTLGNPQAVTMSLAGKDVALSHYKPGRPVNFTLE